MKTMTVANQKSTRISREQNPPSNTTVAQMEARVPAALPAHSRNATQNTILFRVFSFLLTASALRLSLCCTSPPAASACAVGSTEMESSPPLAGVVAIVFVFPTVPVVA